MEFRDGGDAASSSHLPAPENRDDGGNASPFPSGTGVSNPRVRSPLPRNDDEGFQSVFGNYETFRFMVVDCCPCTMCFTIFLCIVSLIISLNVYTTEVFKLGPHSSVLIKPSNPKLMEYVTVETLDRSPSELILYGFDGTPPLNVVNSWSENHNVILSGDAHKEWTYFLNEGSKIDISYNVTTLISSHVSLGIGRGTGELRLFEQYQYPDVGICPMNGPGDISQDIPYSKNAACANTLLMGGPINGTGEIGYYIYNTESYYARVHNMRFDIVEVELQIRIRSLVYDKTNAYYNCPINVGSCSLKIPFSGGTSALLVSPDRKMGIGHNESRVLVSYGPRWITYQIVIGGLVFVYTVLLWLLACECTNPRPRPIKYESSPEEDIELEDIELEDAPLMPIKDYNWARLYYSQSQDRGDPEYGPSAGSQNGIVASDHKFDNNNNRPLCEICSDAPRDSFFIPCGHCVSCYACGTKIAEGTGTCPICGIHIKVKNMYTV